MQKTKISYLDYTYNPIKMRCTPISEGCRNCWAIAMMKRLAKNPSCYADQQRAYAGEPPMLDTKELEAPLHLRKPARIGVQFMGDLFHEKIDVEFLKDIFSVIRACDRHKFFLLTKRPQNINKKYFEYFGNTSYSHVWLGVSVEDQKAADERIPILLQIPTAHRWVSVEPCLGSIDLSRFIGYNPIKTQEGGKCESNIVGKDSVRCGEVGRIRNRRTGEDLESQAQNGSKEGGHGYIPNPQKEGRTQYGDLLSNTINVELEEGLLSSASSCVYALLRGDPRRQDDKPQEREQEGQSTRQFGDDDIFRKSKPCLQDRLKAGEWTQKSELEILSRSDSGNSFDEVRDSCRNENPTRKENFPISEKARGELQRNLGSHQRKTLPIDLVIVGGETGPKARPTHPDWVRKIRDDCQNAGVPFFLKSWGEWAWSESSEMKQYKRFGKFKLHRFEDGTCMYKIGHKNTGRLLDNREYNEIP